MSHQVHRKIQVSTVVNKPIEDVWQSLRHYNDLRYVWLMSSLRILSFYNSWAGLTDTKPKDAQQDPKDNIIGRIELLQLVRDFSSYDIHSS